MTAASWRTDTRRIVIVDGETAAPVEEWRVVPGFPDYEVSSLGRVVSCKNGSRRLLRGYRDTGGYLTVDLHSGPGQRATRTVHRLVVTTFIGPRPEGMEVRHIDGDKSNNALSNLAYGTRSDNIQDQLRHGRHFQANKEHCPAGHPYSVDNTYVKPSGRRACRTCRRQQDQERREASARARLARAARRIARSQFVADVRHYAGGRRWDRAREIAGAFGLAWAFILLIRGLWVAASLAGIVR